MGVYDFTVLQFLFLFIVLELVTRDDLYMTVAIAVGATLLICVILVVAVYSWRRVKRRREVKLMHFSKIVQIMNSTKILKVYLFCKFDQFFRFFRY